MKQLFTILFLLSATLRPAAQEDAAYKASLFGCMSDGVTLNTASIQTAINIISQRGGGSLHFYVGRYLTGTIRLKSNVTIVLHEGATLVGVPSIYDYDSPSGAPKGLIIAEGETNVGVIGALPETPSVPPAVMPEIIGNGIVEGNGVKLREVMKEQQQKGYFVADPQNVPALVSFAGCDGVRVEGLMLSDAAGDVQVYTNCRNVTIARQLVDNRKTPAGNGVVINGCNSVSVSENFFDVTGKAIRTTGNSGKIRIKGNKTQKGAI